jgi:hemolysin activation/secretion protein
VFRFFFSLLIMVGLAVQIETSHAQSVLDQSNTAIIQRDTKDQPEPPRPSRLQIEADTPADDAPTNVTESGVFIGAIRVQGSKRVPIEAFSSAIEPFIGRTLAKDDLARVSRAVGDVARGRGYKFASAFIAAQSLALGILTVTLDEGAIGAVRIEGSKNAQVRRILAPLEGPPQLYAEVERRILVAGDVPGVAIGRVRFTRENGRGVLTLGVSETRISGRAGFDTLGTKSVGPVRAIVSASATSVAVAGDQATVQGAATPVQPNELAFVALRYALPVDADGTVVSGALAYGRSEPSGFLAQFDSVGRSLTYSLVVSRTLLRRRKTNLFLNFEFDQLSSRQSLVGLRARDDRITTLSLSLSGDRQLWGGRLSSQATITQGIGGFDATQRGDPFSSRPDADAIFTKLNLSADWTGSLSGAVSLRLATALQIASAPLLAEQEVGIGGPRFGRAYSFSERSGDDGVLGMIELRSDFGKITSWLESAQAYTFVDGGQVTNLRDGFGGGTLFSGGGGVRGRMGKILFGVETAFPLNEDRFESGDRSPQFNLQLSTSF